MRLFPKILTILHLSFVFIYISWVGLFPFLGEYFNTKAELTSIMSLMGHEGLSHELGGLNIQELEKLKRHKSLFQKLPQEKQERVIREFNDIHTKKELGTLDKISSGLRTLIYGLPLFLQAWLSFSFLICIFLLLKIDGSRASVLLLPIIALVFSFYNFFYGLTPTLPPTAELYPSESELIQTYMKEPLDNGILKQQEQLLGAWKRYLVVNWIHESPSGDTDLYEEQIERAEHAFSTARLFKEWDTRNSKTFLYSELNERQALPLLGFFILWNVFFSFQVRKKDAYSF